MIRLIIILLSISLTSVAYAGNSIYIEQVGTADDLELTIPEVSALESAVINGEPSVKACMKLYAQNKNF